MLATVHMSQLCYFFGRDFILFFSKHSSDGMCLGARVESTARSIILSSLQAVVSASDEYWKRRGQ